MAECPLKTSPLSELDQGDLQRLAQVAGRLLAGRPRLMPGPRPHRLKAGSGIEFLDHREYLPGDDLRNVDWLATARSNRTQVRRFRDETSADWILCLDCSASMGIDSGIKWRLAVQLAAAYAYLLIQLDNRVGVLLFRGRVIDLKPPGRGQRAYASLLQLLERAAPAEEGEGTSLGPCLAHIPSGCQVLVISDFLVENGMAPELARLSAITEAVYLIQVLSRKETRLEQGGRTLLEDIETGTQVSLDSPAERSGKAEQRLHEFRNQLIRHCRKYQIDYSLCHAEDGWRESLVKQIKKQKKHDA